MTDKEYCDLIYNIRATMHTVQAQFEVMDDAVEKCSQLSDENLKECVVAIDNAHSEVLNFLALNVKLARLVDDFRSYIVRKSL